MPMEFRLDHDRRMVLAEGRGLVTSEEVFRYQLDVWSRPEVAGYNELVDMSAATEIREGPPDRVRALAKLAASMDAPDRKSKMAIVAPQDLAFGVARMYQAHRELNEMSTKKVGVFRDRESAYRWLAVIDPVSDEAESGPPGPESEPRKPPSRRPT
jgi:hypothetical protein